MEPKTMRVIAVRIKLIPTIGRLDNLRDEEIDQLQDEIEAGNK